MRDVCAPMLPCVRAASEVRTLLEDDAAGPGLGPSSPDFWVLVAALKAFMVGNPTCTHSFLVSDFRAGTLMRDRYDRRARKTSQVLGVRIDYAVQDNLL